MVKAGAMVKLAVLCHFIVTTEFRTNENRRGSREIGITPDEVDDLSDLLVRGLADLQVFGISSLYPWVSTITVCDVVVRLMENQYSWFERPQDFGNERQINAIALAKRFPTERLNALSFV